MKTIGARAFYISDKTKPHTYNISASAQARFDKSFDKSFFNNCSKIKIICESPSARPNTENPHKQRVYADFNMVTHRGFEPRTP